MCFEHFKDEDQMEIITKLYDSKTKKEKDLYLMGLIEYSPVQRRRCRKENPAFVKKGSYTFFVIKQLERIQVCRKAYCSLHAVR